MTQPERAFERLQSANPHAVEEIDRLAGEQFLTLLTAPTLTPVLGTTRRKWRALAAGFVVVLAALPITLYGTRGQGPPVANAPVEFEPNVPILVEELHFTGEHRTDELGTPFTITPTGAWGHTVVHDGYVRILDEEHGGELTFIRATGLSNPDDPFASVADESWPIGDVDGWLDRLDSHVEASNVVTVELDGSEVLRFDLAVTDGAPCISDSACAAFVTNHKIDNAPISLGQSHRVWWIPQDGFEPIVVVASGDSLLIDSATALVHTMTLGPARPHPIAGGNVWEAGYSLEVPAGPVRLPALGGVEFEFQQAQHVEQGTDRLTLGVSTFSSVKIFYLVSGPQREPITTIADVVTQMDSLGVSLTDLGEPDALLAGGEAFDLVRGPDVSRESAFGDSTGGLTWSVPASSRLWLFETNRGVLIVSAESGEGTFGLDEAITLAEGIVPTLRLIDSQSLGG